MNAAARGLSSRSLPPYYQLEGRRRRTINPLARASLTSTEVDFGEEASIVSGWETSGKLPNWTSSQPGEGGGVTGPWGRDGSQPAFTRNLPAQGGILLGSRFSSGVEAKSPSTLTCLLAELPTLTRAASIVFPLRFFCQALPSPVAVCQQRT